MIDMAFLMYKGRGFSTRALRNCRYFNNAKMNAKAWPWNRMATKPLYFKQDGGPPIFSHAVKTHHDHSSGNEKCLIQSCRENKSIYLFSKVFRKSCHLWDNVEKCGTARQATDENIIRRMRFACRITKATDTYSWYVILLFHGNSGYVNAPHYYVYVLCLCCFTRTRCSVNMHRNCNTRI